MGAPGGTYIFASTFDDWGEMDAWSQVPELMTKSFGEAEATMI